MLAHAVILFFLICPADDEAFCVEGTIWARSCAAAVASARDILPPQHTLHITVCEVAR